MQRLQTRSQFQAALAGGTVSRTAHFALHRLTFAPSNTQDAIALSTGSEKLSTGQPSQALFASMVLGLGAMVPKRWAKRAVTRNTIKRQVYAVAALFGSRLPSAAYVVRLRATFDRKEFVSATSEPLRRAIRAELLQLFERAVRSKVAAPPAPEIAP